MKLIDSDKIIEALGAFSDKTHGDPHFLNGIKTAREIIEGMPEAVVRCRDCDQYDFDYEHKGWCNACCFVVDERHYCSYGERKSDEID